MTAKHYGIVDEIAQHEPDGVIGNLSISAVLADSVHAPASLIVVGSTTDSPTNLAQLVLTAEQAIALGAHLTAAGADALEADRKVERLRNHGRGTGPERTEIDRVAGLLIAEWERVERKPVNVSYIATFADMARAVIADTAAREATLRAELAEARMLARDAQIQAMDRGASYQAISAELAEAHEALTAARAEVEQLREQFEVERQQSEADKDMLRRNHRIQCDRRNEALTERDAYRAMLCDLLASAHPHPVEHPTMAEAWGCAREVLRTGAYVHRVPVPTAPERSTQACGRCNKHHPLDMFFVGQRVIVDGKHGTVVSWTQYGGPLSVRVEYDTRDEAGDLIRGNFYPCQVSEEPF